MVLLKWYFSKAPKSRLHPDIIDDVETLASSPCQGRQPALHDKLETDTKKKKNTEKNIKKKALRTLWVRRKKKAA